MAVFDAILLGGGLGQRFNGPSSSGLAKQFRKLNNTPVFIYSIKHFLSMGCFRQIIFVCPHNYRDLAESQISDHFKNSPIPIQVVGGGKRRQDSSWLGLQAVSNLTPLPHRVLLHDACRPILRPALQNRIQEKLHDQRFGAWVPVVPVVDTLKKVNQKQVETTVDRSKMWRAQTPQIFDYSLIRSLVEKARIDDSLEVTDDASICEHFGVPVGVFEGEPQNIKLTYDFEQKMLESLLKAEEEKVQCESVSDTTYTV